MPGWLETYKKVSPDPKAASSVLLDLEAAGFVSPDPKDAGFVSPKVAGSVSPDLEATGSISPGPLGAVSVEGWGYIYLSLSSPTAIYDLSDRWG